MATNKMLEQVAARIYPHAMKHLQQLIMDAENCSKAFGKKSLFGADKFEIACKKFNQTIGKCAVALHEDGYLDSFEDMDLSMIEVGKAVKSLELAYSSWPIAFDFWRNWYVNYVDSVSVSIRSNGKNNNNVLGEFFRPNASAQRINEIADAATHMFNDVVLDLNLRTTALAARETVLTGTSRISVISIVKNMHPQLSYSQAARFFDKLNER